MCVCVGVINELSTALCLLRHADVPGSRSVFLDNALCYFRGCYSISYSNSVCESFVVDIISLVRCFRNSAVHSTDYLFLSSTRIISVHVIRTMSRDHNQIAPNCHCASSFTNNFNITDAMRYEM